MTAFSIRFKNVLKAHEYDGENCNRQAAIEYVNEYFRRIGFGCQVPLSITIEMKNTDSFIDDLTQKINSDYV